MTYERLIARRYLLSRRQLGFVNVLSWISITGVTVGVAALVVVLSVFNGFSGLVKEILISFDPHIRIEREAAADTSAYDAVFAAIAAQKEVQASAAFVSGKALVVARNVNRVITIVGMEPDRIGEVSGIAKKMVLGSLDLNEPGIPGIVVGMVLADRLGVVVGDTISVISPAGAEAATLHMGVPVIRRFRLVGMYESNNKDYDSFYAVTSLSGGQSLFSTAGTIDGIDIRLHDYTDASRVSARLRDAIGSGYRVLTWYDLHRELYTVMQLERWGAYVILCLIIAVASFNLLGSLTMTVIEKRRDIGILKAMGASDESIRRMFRWQGLSVGLAGTILGNIVGLGVVELQHRYHVFPLDPTVYIIPAIPVEVHVLDLLVISAAATLLCAVAARFPATRASSLNPVEAIRWE